MKKKNIKNQVVIYQAKNGAIELRHDADKQTMWANLNQIADLFDVQKAAISKHLKNIFVSKELSEKGTVSKMETVRTEGDRAIKRSIEIYNLDAIIAVGYRVNSRSATQFRIWATKTLSEHITKGYTVNRRRLSDNYVAFMQAITHIQTLLPEHITLDPKVVLDLVKEFASTWVSLDAYDKDTLIDTGATKKFVSVTSEQLVEALADFRMALIEKNEASELFGQERQPEAISGIVGNVMQSFGGQPVYPTVEEKAAHLLYFMVKNHPFSDGNKRSGAFAFVWFLNRAGILNRSKITPPALTALTLLVAESDPKNKERMIKLVLQLLKK